MRSSSEDTRAFYERLMSGAERRGLWGKESRFDPDNIRQKTSVRKHFADVAEPFLGPDVRCLDFGCGPGGFLTVLSGLCGQAVGVDLVPSFVDEARSALERHGIQNATVQLANGDSAPFDDGEFDRVVMVDTIHHLEAPEVILAEVSRILKPGGLLLVFEPNKLNPVLTALCVLDRNEHGLLRLGTFGAYRRLLGSNWKIVTEAYNGLLIGPSGKLSLAAADFLTHERCSRLLGWLSPKIFFVARKLGS